MPTEIAVVNQLESDLGGLKNQKASVQCIDTISGCVAALARLNYPQSTGMIYDEFIFGRELPPTLLKDRASFLKQLALKPPDDVIVMGGLFPIADSSYEKLQSWKEFDHWLRRDYVIVSERGSETSPGSYRVYRRKV